MNVESEIEGVCKNEGADLVVMGAYSRSRMRELVFGGMTQYMLFETRMPVFALHS